MSPEKPTNQPNQPQDGSPKQPDNGQKPKSSNGNSNSSSGRPASRGAAIRAQRRTQDDANRIANQYLSAAQSAQAHAKDGDQPPRRANVIDDQPRLRIIGLGGMDSGGSKNMILVEYLNDVVIMDCGNDLGVTLPGINYGIADTTYLESVKHKLKGYIITHGHLDHIGGLPHIVPNFPAPIYGSKFSIGRVEEIFQNFGLPMPDGFELKTVTMNEDTHERLKVGAYFVELVRVTHSIPGSTCIVLDTPVGRIINTGDFRLDPNPLDQEKTDTDRLIELGKEGVLALLSESTTTDRPGRTPSESTIEQSLIDIMDNAPGRIFVGLFSTNMKRVQMIINAAVHHNRKVAMDGRSMVSTLEMAVRYGFVKIPKGTFVPIANANTMKDNELVVVCTGSQGEPSSALQRMSTGDHRHVKLKEQDTVVFSSSPIPYTGNDAKIRAMVDELNRKNVHVFQHITRDIDNHGPLHVSGHGSVEEYRDMIDYTNPKFFIPIYGDFTAKRRHIDIALEQGIPRLNTVNVGNGEVIALTPDALEVHGEVPHGTILVDQTGAVVSNVVVKDRLILAEEGMVAVVLTIDRRSGNLLTSPDIISRGFIYMRDSEELMTAFRTELKRAVQQRFKRIDLDRFKAELKDHVTHFLFEHTGRSPIVIPVVNIIGGSGGGKPAGNRPQAAERPASQTGDRPPSAGAPVPTYQTANSPEHEGKTPQQIAAEQQVRFDQMRARLLGQDARTD